MKVADLLKPPLPRGSSRDVGTGRRVSNGSTFYQDLRCPPPPTLPENDTRCISTSREAPLLPRLTSKADGSFSRSALSSTWSSSFGGYSPNLTSPRPPSLPSRCFSNESPSLLASGSVSSISQQKGGLGLMSRRTFSVYDGSPGRSSSPRDFMSPRPMISTPPTTSSQFEGSPGSNLPVVARQSASSSFWRPPRPPNSLLATIDSKASANGDGALLPSPLSQRRFSIRSPDVPSPPARPESEGCYSRCSDPGPKRSCLRAPGSERAQSNPPRRVSFSCDCKPAPPASISDLLARCSISSNEDSESVKKNLATSSGGNSRASSTPRAQSGSLLPSLATRPLPLRIFSG